MISKLYVYILVFFSHISSPSCTWSHLKPSQRLFCVFGISSNQRALEKFGMFLTQKAKPITITPSVRKDTSQFSWHSLCFNKWRIEPGCSATPSLQSDANPMYPKHRRVIKRYGKALRSRGKSSDGRIPPVTCSCWKPRIFIPAISIQNCLRQFPAGSTMNLHPASTCQIGPKSHVRRLRREVANTCSSFVSEIDISLQTASITSPTPSLWKITLGFFLIFKALESSSLVDLTASRLSKGSMPGDFQMTTTQPSRAVPNFHTPIAFCRTLQAYPKVVPTATCQCSPKFRSKAFFKILANNAHRSSSAKSWSWLNFTWRLKYVLTASWIFWRSLGCKSYFWSRASTASGMAQCDRMMLDVMLDVKSWQRCFICVQTS